MVTLIIIYGGGSYAIILCSEINNINSGVKNNAIEMLEEWFEWRLNLWRERELPLNMVLAEKVS